MMDKNSKVRLLENSGQGIAKSPAPTSELDRSRVNWDYLRVFMTVAEARSLRSAAAMLALDPTTVSRRIKTLEESLGAPLLLKSPDGVHLTDLGARIYQQARDLANVVADIERQRQVAGSEMSGRVRLSVTEGLGVFWVLPRLIEVQRANPLITFDVKCTMQLANTLGAETDIAVQFERPRESDLVTFRLGALHATPFVSKGYAERFGVPTTLSELSKHKFISQSAEQGTSEDGLLRALNVRYPEGVISFRSGSSVAQYELVKHGGGIGFLATYAACFDRSLVPIEIETAHATLGIWLVYHPQAKNIPRVAATIELLKQMFDRRRFPWFRDEYIPPSQLASLPNDDWSAHIVDDGT